MADKATREGGAARFAAPAGPKRLAVELARLNYSEALLREVALTLLKTAQHPDANTLSLLHTVPGLGTLLSRVVLDEIQAMHRFPTVQEVVSYGRVGQGAKASAGKRLGTAGTKIGKGQLTGAFSAAAVWGLRAHPPAPTYLARLARQHANGNALTVLAQTLGRAVYDLLQRPVAFDKEQCFPHDWRGADAPGASLDPPGMHLPDALETAASRASWKAQARVGRETLSPGL